MNREWLHRALSVPNREYAHFTAGCSCTDRLRGYAKQPNILRLFDRTT